MKKSHFLLFLALLFAAPAIAQVSVLDGVYVKEHTITRQPMPYVFLREADIMWNKRIWRVIDINEKINLPFKYPQSSFRLIKENRQNLADVLFDALQEGRLTAYNFNDDEFTMQMTYKEIETQGGARVDTVRMMAPDPPYDEFDTVLAVPFNRDNIFGYRLKEEWFFDKQRSVMEVRIIGLAPLVYARDQFGEVRESMEVMTLCWFYYPEIRPILASKEVFNRQNDAERRTFDDIFQKRIFSSYVIKENNVYDRKIADYRTGIFAITESNRIKKEIVDLEHDMWEY